MKKLIIVFFIVLTVLYESLSIVYGSMKSDYQELNASFFKHEFDNSKNTKGYVCNWFYGKGEKYHLFDFVCIKDEDPKGSFLKTIKRYKVNNKELNVTINSKEPHLNSVVDSAWMAIGPGTDLVIIKWE